MRLIRLPAHHITFWEAEEAIMVSLEKIRNRLPSYAALEYIDSSETGWFAAHVILFRPIYHSGNEGCWYEIHYNSWLALFPYNSRWLETGF